MNSATKQLLVQKKIYQFEAKKILISPNEPINLLIYLRKGYVKQYLYSIEGNELIIHIYGPDSLFPLFVAFDLVENRYFFESITPVEISKVSKKEANAYLQSDTQFSIDLIKRLLLGLDGLSKRIEINSFAKASQRVASVLLYLAIHFGENTKHGYIIKHWFTHEEIGSLVGITREHVSIEMKNLEQHGLITYENHSLIIPNIEKLQDFVVTL